MDGDTSSVICSFRPEFDVRVGVYDPQEQLTVNVLCISELHYCKSIVGVLQALCFLLTVTVKWSKRSDHVCNALKSSYMSEMLNLQIACRGHCPSGHPRLMPYLPAYWEPSPSL